MRWPSAPGFFTRWFAGDSTSAGRVRYLYDLTRHCLRELSHDHAEQMAAALTYRTIFSLVPMVVLALIVFRGFGGLDTEKAAKDLQNRIFQWSGLSSISYEAPPPPAAETQPEVFHETVVDSTTQPTTQPTATQPAAPPKLNTPQKREGAREGVQYILSRLTNQVANINLASIGAIGLVIFIWAALGLAISLEAIFNSIYNAPSGRPWHLRITIYWAAITLAPVLLFVSLYVAGKLNHWVEGLSNVPRMGPDGTLSHSWAVICIGIALTAVLTLVSQFTALLASWLLLFLLYRLLPNTQVRWKPALIGSLVAAIFWELGKLLFQLYVRKAVPYSAIYGSLGLVPLFLFWIYITWLIVLFGLELSYALQVIKSGKFKYTAAKAQHDHFYDPRWLIPMMGVIGRAFIEGRNITREQVAQELSLPVRIVTCLAEGLENAALIHQTQIKGEGDAGYVLALPPEKIPLARLLDLSRSITRESQVEDQSFAERKTIPGWSFLDDLTAMQREKAGEATLANLIKP